MKLKLYTTLTNGINIQTAASKQILELLKATVHKSRANEIGTVEPNTVFLGPPVQNLLLVTLVASTVMGWPLSFREMFFGKCG